MLVSWNWLTEYLRLEEPVELLTERLALTGLNLESIADVGGDIAIDLEVTSNRPDCLGHIGIAREISVVFGKALCIPDPQPPTDGAPIETVSGVSVEDEDLCPRFTARVISGVKVGESPWWLRKRLETIGVRPISNIVDVTNYVMFECGQPLHAYDLDRLAENRLVIRRARKSEKLTAINNKVYDLNPEMLVIADAIRPVGLAGVMGGLETEIGSDTTNVLIESARFDPISVRRTSRALSLFSPASFRFERAIDPKVTEWASRRCVELILKVGGGTLHPGLIDLGRPASSRLPITLRLSQIERILGIRIDREVVVRILRALGLESLEVSPTSVTVLAPTWRSDLEREIDLIEEVARIHGYEHIAEDRAVPLAIAPRSTRERVESIVREYLNATGFDESVTFSLVEERLSASLQPGHAVGPLRIDHSSRRRENALRQSLVPSLLSVRQYNESHGQFDADIFEIANVYLPKGGDTVPLEPTRLAIVSGQDFRGLKGVVEGLLKRLHTTSLLRAHTVELPIFEQGRAAELFLGESHLGFLGEIDRSYLKELELRDSCAAVELELDVLWNQARIVSEYQTLPVLPPVVRDLSLVLANDLKWVELSETVIRSAGKALESIEYLDTYRGGNLPEGLQSVHFSMVFRDRERTLTGEEVDDYVRAVVDECENRFKAKLRG